MAGFDIEAESAVADLESSDGSSSIQPWVDQHASKSPVMWRPLVRVAYFVYPLIYVEVGLSLF
jgi:hypothetical protein